MVQISAHIFKAIYSQKLISTIVVIVLINYDFFSFLYGVSNKETPYSQELGIGIILGTVSPPDSVL